MRQIFPSDDGMPALARKRRTTDKPTRQSKKKRSSSSDDHPVNGDDSGSFPIPCLRASPPADLGLIDGMQSDTVSVYLPLRLPSDDPLCFRN